MKFVPEPSERCTPTMARCGKIDARIELFDLASSQYLMLPRQMSAKVLPSRTILAGLHAWNIDDRHDAADHRGKLGQACGLEVGGKKRLVAGAERSTVFALICAMPPPDPIG
jgi:hypothetical protein